MTPWQCLREDVRRTYAYADGGALRRALICARAPGVQAVVVYRYGQWCRHQWGPLRVFLEPLYLLAFDLIRVLWGIELPRSAQIGPGLYIGHFGGIIISGAARIGANCNLSQGVTIGVSGDGPRRGVPVIGDNVYIGPGACVFGRIRVGDNVKIGANAVVARDVPDDAIAALAPGFTLLPRRDSAPVTEELLDHAD